jgi:hypothetical protein
VRPLFPEADTEGELAYRLWRRGLKLSLAEAAGLSVAVLPGITDERLATLVAQRLLLCRPLLQRTGKLALVSRDVPVPDATSYLTWPALTPEHIDNKAAEAIVGLGGNHFCSSIA